MHCYKPRWNFQCHPACPDSMPWASLTEPRTYQCEQNHNIVALHKTPWGRQLVSATTCSSRHFCNNSGSRVIIFYCLYPVGCTEWDACHLFGYYQVTLKFHWNFSTRSEQRSCKFYFHPAHHFQFIQNLQKIVNKRVPHSHATILPEKYVSYNHRLIQIGRDTWSLWGSLWTPRPPSQKQV